MNQDLYDLSREEVTKRLEACLALLVKNEARLFGNEVHENSFNSHLHGYLKEIFPSADVDHDYDRYLTENKIVDTPAGKREILPDLIVHEQQMPRNLLAIEVKKDTSLTPKKEAKDINKLMGLRHDPLYSYRHAVFVILKMKSKSWELKWID